MRLDFTQQMRLEQQMKLAPRMIQSMEILQLPILALEERIEQELVSNPVLEMREPTEDSNESAPSTTEEQTPSTTEENRDLTVAGEGSQTDDFQRLDNVAHAWDDYFSRSSRASVRRSSGERDRKLDAMMNTPARDVSLQEYLSFQLALSDADGDVRRAGEAIVSFVDEDGYLRTPLAEVIESLPRPRPSDADAAEALGIIQSFDPPGVAARDLRECLLLQLAAQSGDHRIEEQLVRDHLKDIEQNRFPVITRALNCRIEDVKDAIEHIRKLSPRPGAAIGGEVVPYISPDVIVEYDNEENDYTIRLTDGHASSLYISGLYRRMLKSGRLDDPTREFIQDNIRSARWLIESIQQRRNTLFRVVSAVMAHQRDFLEKGPKHLRPLPMSQIADELGIHRGTVSRAASEKYVQTPRGIYPLRAFFSGGTSSDEGSVSWDGIKAKIQDIVDHEDKKAPLSDDEIVKRLGTESIHVARRTVTKYRKLLSIPSMRRRKEF
jgi:RNA polymerase sigma-54 factor